MGSLRAVTGCQRANPGRTQTRFSIFCRRRLELSAILAIVIAIRRYDYLKYAMNRREFEATILKS